MHCRAASVESILIKMDKSTCDSLYLVHLSRSSLMGCGDKQTAVDQANQASAEANQTAKAAPTAAEVEAETARLNTWFEAKYEEGILRSPIQLAFLGRSERQGEIDQMSEAALEENLAFTRKNLEDLKSSFDYDKLSDDAKISYDVWVYQAEA